LTEKKFYSNGLDGLKGEKMVEKWLQSDPQIKPLTLRAIKKLPQKLEGITKAVKNNANREIEFKAHDLKGFALNFNFNEIYSISKEINEEAKNQNCNYKKISILHKQLKSLVNSIPKKYLD